MSIDLSVNYLGMRLKNPVLVGSSGLTNSLKKNIELAGNGAGAIILKSLFEEQILAYYSRKIDANVQDYPEAVDYITAYSREKSINEYIELIEETRKAVDIPVIASINCITDADWMYFAERIEKAGADALELNIALLPVNEKTSAVEYEQKYFDILEKVNKRISIPVALKMSSYFSGLANFVQKLSWSGYVKGFVLFNRFYAPDIDIENLKIVPSTVFTTSKDINLPLRWIALLSDKIESDLSATTGIHTSTDVIKLILAGATTVQMVSSLYQNSPDYIQTVLKEITEWMKKKNFNSIDDFKGKMSYANVPKPLEYERIQFMKHYGGIE